MNEVFPLLKKFWPRLQLPPGASVLVPLCGKTLDIEWFIKLGYYVIGVDISEKALKEITERLDLPAPASSKGDFTYSKYPGLELWKGDFLKLQDTWIPHVDAIYDKAALIALPPQMRQAYANTISRLSQPHTQQLVNCFEYVSAEMNGPPFAVHKQELKQLYGDTFNLELLHSHSILDALPGFQRRGLHSYLREKIYHLKPIMP